jgi:hypothetical protein
VCVNPEGGDPYLRVRLEYDLSTVRTVLASVLPVAFVRFLYGFWYGFFTDFLRLFYGLRYGFLRVLYDFFTGWVTALTA